VVYKDDHVLSRNFFDFILYLGFTRVVDLLLKHNASVNNIGMKTMTALLAATKGGHAATALRLLENRTIDIKIQDKVKLRTNFQ
jgi:hypothetical protein